MWSSLCLWEGWGLLEGKSSSLPLRLIPHVHAMGVNHEKPESSLKIISNALWTTNHSGSPAQGYPWNFHITEDSPSQSMPSTLPRDWWWPLWQTMVWGSWCCPEHHPCNQRHCQECVLDLTCHLERAAKFDIKNVVEQVSEGSWRASWATLRTRRSPVTLTESLTSPPWCRAWHCPQWTFC